MVSALNPAAAGFGAALGDRAAESAGAGPRVAGPLDAIYSSLAARDTNRNAGDVVRCGNCPFHALAQEHTELVCGMNVALVHGMAERAPGDVTATLDPAPDRCCVTLTAG